MARRSKARRDGLDRRIRRVLRWLDAEPDAERVAEYRALAIEEHGSVQAGLEADERAMTADHPLPRSGAVHRRCIESRAEACKAMHTRRGGA